MRPKTKTINILLQDGGLGDKIAELVAVDYIIRKYPYITPLVWVPDLVKEVAQLLLPRDTFVRGFSEMRGLYDPSKPTKTTKWDGYTSSMKIHTVDYAFLKLCDELPPIEEKNYLQMPLSDHKRTDVIITTGFTAEVREWAPQSVNAVVDYVIKKGYTPVFLGTKAAKTGTGHIITADFNKEIDFSGGHDLRDKTSLYDALFYMGRAAAVVGVDNGLMHLAGCTQTPIVGGFTTVNPEIRMPIRHNELGWQFYPVVPDETLVCLGSKGGFCQQNTNFLYGHDYRYCIYKKTDPNKDRLCVKQLTAEKFITQLEKIL